MMKKMEQLCCCHFDFSILVTACNYCTDLHVEELDLVYLNVEGFSTKEKVWEIHFPYLSQKWHFPAQVQNEVP